MQLARNHFIIGTISAILLSSCAQIGNVSGGDEDVFAPAPVKERTTPPDGTVNFKGKEVSITFDEYFKLNLSNDNIVMVPPHATIKTRVKKKTLTLYWEDTLRENTTYSIYLNNAVADITEGNDSIIQYVFSTGPELDSIEYVTFVGDSRTGSARANISVILYSNDGDELISVGKTDGSGKAILRNLQAGVYSLIAINDANKNLALDPDEELGFQNDEFLTITESMVDSSVIRLFPQQEEAGIKTTKFIEPASIIISATRSLQGAKFDVNEQQISLDQLRYLSEDSVHIFLRDSVDGSITVAVNTELFSDTVKMKLRSSRDQSIRFNKIKKQDLAPSDTLFLELNDVITKLDSSRIHLRRKSDSSSVAFQSQLALNRCYFFPSTRDREVFFTVEAGAFECAHGLSPEFNTTFNLLEERKFGTIVLDLNAYGEPVVVYINKDGKTEQIVQVNNPKQLLTLKELFPGEYTFKVIRDVNGNGRWDSGDLNNRTQPELIDLYSEPSKLRANWELTIPLKPQK